MTYQQRLKEIGAREEVYEHVRAMEQGRIVGIIKRHMPSEEMCSLDEGAQIAAETVAAILADVAGGEA